KRIKSHLSQSLRVELAFAGWRRETTFGERCISFRQVETSPTFFLQSFKSDAFQSLVRRLESLADDVFVGVLETILLKTHFLSQQPEDFPVWLCFAKRGNRRLVVDEVVVSIRPDHISMFELCRCRKQYVRIIGGVRLKLLVDYGEQIFSRQTFQYL